LPGALVGLTSQSPLEPHFRPGLHGATPIPELLQGPPNSPVLGTGVGPFEGAGVVMAAQSQVPLQYIPLLLHRVGMEGLEVPAGQAQKQSDTPEELFLDPQVPSLAAKVGVIMIIRDDKENSPDRKVIQKSLSVIEYILAWGKGKK
jgi:hypothetical protein